MFHELAISNPIACLFSPENVSDKNCDDTIILFATLSVTTNMSMNYSLII